MSHATGTGAHGPEADVPPTPPLALTPAQQSLADRIDAALPQTQCTRCGYPDCLGYAQAIAQGQARINQCPPGGYEGIVRLAQITGLPVLPLSASHGHEAPRTVAVIDEQWCIGCTQCLDACPTDAIVGSHKLMHTVIEPHCTGCELCIPVCPVDCIALEPVTGERTGWAAWSAPQADAARQRYHARRLRRGQDTTLRSTPGTSPAAAAAPDPAEARKAAITAALERARQRKAAGAVPAGQRAASDL